MQRKAKKQKRHFLTTCIFFVFFWGGFWVVKKPTFSCSFRGYWSLFSQTPCLQMVFFFFSFSFFFFLFSLFASYPSSYSSSFFPFNLSSSLFPFFFFNPFSNTSCFFCLNPSFFFCFFLCCFLVFLQVSFLISSSDLAFGNSSSFHFLLFCYHLLSLLLAFVSQINSVPTSQELQHNVFFRTLCFQQCEKLCFWKVFVFWFASFQVCFSENSIL